MPTKLKHGVRPVCTPEEYLMCSRRTEMCGLRKADTPCPALSPVIKTIAGNTNTPDNKSNHSEKTPVKVTFVVGDAALYEAAKKVANDEGRFMSAVISNLLRLYVYEDVGRINQFGMKRFV